MARNKENFHELTKVLNANLKMLEANLEMNKALTAVVSNLDADSDNSIERKARHDEKKRQESKK